MGNVMITASIVTFHNDIIQLQGCIDSVLKFVDKLYISDNSFNKDIEKLCVAKSIEYHHNGKNLGFGRAHNIVIDKAILEGSDYHLIVNPDIFFSEDVVSPMIEFMEERKDVGMMMPRILYPSGEVQYLPKLLPSPFALILRKIKWPKRYYEKFISEYELRSVKVDRYYNAPILSGCFSVLRLSAIEEIGAYDERFFMYFEDFDLSRRMHKRYKTLYYPFVSVFHGYERGANKSVRLLKIFIISAIKYFNKWGWLFDKERTIMNRQTLKQF